MKKLEFYLCVIGLLTACVKEDGVKDLAHESQMQNLVFVGEVASDDAMKTYLTYNNEVWWHSKEEINVFYGPYYDSFKPVGGKFVSTNEEPAKSVEFSGSLPLDPSKMTAKNSYWAIYPYNENNSLNRDGVILTVPDVQVATLGSVSKNMFPSVAVSKDMNLAFYNLCGGIKFSVSQKNIQAIIIQGKNNETIAGTVQCVVADDKRPYVSSYIDKKTKVVVTAPNNGTFSKNTYYYAALLPRKLWDGYTITFVKSGAIGTYNSSNTTVEIKRSTFGVISKADQYVTFESANNLSSSNKYANCYVVGNAGLYMFYVTKGSSTQSVGTPVASEVIWESFGNEETPNKGDIITDVFCVSDRVYFRVPDNKKSGNALVAVKDAEGKILWSWHIWRGGFASQSYNNGAGYVMDRNLGATSNEIGKTSALGLLYQWGRKDPFLGPANTSDDEKMAKSTLATWPETVTSTEEVGTVEYATQHPTTFIYGNSTNSDWQYVQDKNRWASTKTMYDPCPYGWRVPDGGKNGLWATALGVSSSWTTTKNWMSAYHGMNFGNTDKRLGTDATIWYPATGYLYNGVDYFSNLSSKGFWWSCTTVYNEYATEFFERYANYFSIASNGETDLNGMFYGNRSYAYSVRCVKQ